MAKKSHLMSSKTIFPKSVYVSKESKNVLDFNEYKKYQLDGNSKNG